MRPQAESKSAQSPMLSQIGLKTKSPLRRRTSPVNAAIHLSAQRFQWISRLINETSAPRRCLKFFALIFCEVILIKTWLFPSGFTFPACRHSDRILTLTILNFADDKQHIHSAWNIGWRKKRRSHACHGVLAQRRNTEVKKRNSCRRAAVRNKRQFIPFDTRLRQVFGRGKASNA